MYAQSIAELPTPGVMVRLSSAYNPALIKGLKLYPDNPLRFDFIVDKGQDPLSDEDFREESTKLIKYFLTSLTIPENDFWVNLSPYEKDRIVPSEFGITEMGRDLLAQDYLLKEITSTLMYPEDEVGQKFWDKIYKVAQEKYGVTKIPVDTFNKVWIVPEKAVLYANGDKVFVVESKLKVMLEEDYLSSQKTVDSSQSTVDSSQKITATDKEDNPDAGQRALATGIIREVIIPELEKEVNRGKHFAPLRQIYDALILATWYKMNLRDSLLSKVYVDQNKIRGVEIDDKQAKDKIYQKYIEAFKKGVYNYVKEDFDPLTQQIIPRKYFSGGMQLAQKLPQIIQIENSMDPAMLPTDNLVLVKSVARDYSMSDQNAVNEKLSEFLGMTEKYTSNDLNSKFNELVMDLIRNHPSQLIIPLMNQAVQTKDQKVISNSFEIFGVIDEVTPEAAQNIEKFLYSREFTSNDLDLIVDLLVSLNRKVPVEQKKLLKMALYDLKNNPKMSLNKKRVVDEMLGDIGEANNLLSERQKLVADQIMRKIQKEEPSVFDGLELPNNEILDNKALRGIFQESLKAALLNALKGFSSENINKKMISALTEQAIFQIAGSVTYFRDEGIPAWADIPDLDIFIFIPKESYIFVDKLGRDNDPLRHYLGTSQLLKEVDIRFSDEVQKRTKLFEFNKSVSARILPLDSLYSFETPYAKKPYRYDLWYVGAKASLDEVKSKIKAEGDKYYYLIFGWYTELFQDVYSMLNEEGGAAFKIIKRLSQLAQLRGDKTEDQKLAQLFSEMKRANVRGFFRKSESNQQVIKDLLKKADPGLLDFGFKVETYIDAYWERNQNRAGDKDGAMLTSEEKELIAEGLLDLVKNVKDENVEYIVMTGYSGALSKKLFKMSWQLKFGNITDMPKLVIIPESEANGLFYRNGLSPNSIGKRRTIEKLEAVIKKALIKSLLNLTDIQINSMGTSDINGKWDALKFEEKNISYLEYVSDTGFKALLAANAFLGMGIKNFHMISFLISQRASEEFSKRNLNYFIAGRVLPDRELTDKVVQIIKEAKDHQKTMGDYIEILDDIEGALRMQSGYTKDVLPDRAMSDVGGIDLNPTKIDITTEGEGIDLKFPYTPEEFQNRQIQGLIPIIFDIVPVNNLPLFLGLQEQPREVPPAKATL